MKKHFYFLLAMLISASVYGQDYYWVGNSGNWSDVSHWATSSGGSEFHTELPGPENDVYFDVNSFSLENQEVTLDLEEAFCRDLNATGVQFNPQLKGVGFYDDLYIHGSLILPAEMARSLKGVNMMSEGTEQIVTGEILLALFFNITGPGEFHLMDSLTSSNLYSLSGTFISNDNPVNILSRVYGHIGQDNAMHMGNSNVYANLWQMDEDIDLEMEMATLYYGAPVNPFETFDGGGHHYHRVVFEGTADIADDSSYDIFEALPGASLNFEPGSIQTAEQFIFSGTSEEGITISSLESGVQATLSQMSGEVSAEYLVLSDNNATGGATFNADESVDLGNNTGWNITINVPQDYYWVGGSGNWNDPSHWATLSGGAEFHEEPPSAIDAVFFDGNSFDESGQTVNLGAGSINCRDFLVSNVTEGVIFQQASSGVINVYGDFTVDQNADFNLSEIRMQSNAAVTIDTEGNLLGNNCEVLLTGGGVYNLGSDLNCRELFIDANNDFVSAGFDVLLDFSFTVIFPFEGLVDLSNSYVETRLFQHSVDPGQMIVENTVFYITSSFSGYGLGQVDLITLDGSDGNPIHVNGSFTMDELTVVPGTTLEMQAGNTFTLNNVSLEGTAELPITITSSQPGTEAYFVKTSGEVSGTHLIISDNHASGGASFNAIDSELGGNVEGWNLMTDLDRLPDLQISCYPNPTTGPLRIEAPIGTQCTIMDLTGRTVKEFVCQLHFTDLDLSHLSEGVYFVKSQLQNRQTVQKRIVVAR